MIQIVDAYGYWPMVRQVFGHCVFRPHEGHMAEPAEIAAGLAASAAVLQALEEIAQEGHVLSGSSLTRAECHLAPMIAAFTSAPQGASLLRAHPALWHWWCGFAARPAMRDTDTGFDQLPT